MKPLRDSALYLTAMVASLCLFGAAYADGGAAGAATSAAEPNVQLPSGWAGLLMIVLVALSWALRQATKQSSGKVAAFLHSSAGALASGAVTAVLPGLIQATQHGWDLRAFETALVGGLFSYFAVNNPSNTADEQKDKVAGMKAAPADSGKSSVPPPPPVALLLPVAFLMFVGTGCTPVFKQCIAKSGIANAGTIEGQVYAALDGAIDAPSVVAALEGIAIKLAPTLGQDAWVAVECAISSWQAQNPLPKLSSPAPGLLAAHQGANEFMMRHFTQPTSSMRLHRVL